jgi:acetyl-CoA synthetase
MREGSDRCDAYIDAWRKTARVNGPEMYKALYSRALDSPEEFWAEQALNLLSWEKPWEWPLRADFEEGKIEWFKGGALNAAYNCLDVRLDAIAEKPAYFWEGSRGEAPETITYRDLFRRVNRLAAALRAYGVRRGDRVALHLPDIPDLPVAMLACARIGAVHCVVSSQIGVEALSYRLSDLSAKAVVTAEAAYSGGSETPLKARLDNALLSCPSVETVFVVRRKGVEGAAAMTSGRDVWLDEALDAYGSPEPLQPEWMDAEAPLFVLYAGAPAGKPKGVVHTHGGYLVYAAFSARMILDLRDDDVLWIADELGGIFGHTYGLYGALLNGVSCLLREGTATASAGTVPWSLIDKYRVTNFWTPPSAIRSAASRDLGSVDSCDLSSLRLAGFMGEAVDTATWNWMHERVCRRGRPVVHGYGQTETGGMVIAPFPAVKPLKPGSCALPFFGVKPVILDPTTGEETAYPDQEGILCIVKPWPGIARTIFGDHDRFLEGAFYRVPGSFFTGDGAVRDSDGEYRVTGRVDDVIISAGRRIGIPELENALMRHPQVGEAAVVGYPHPVRGRGAHAFVQASEGPSDDLESTLKNMVREIIGDFAVIDRIQWVDTLPRTPSGKILRVILQRIAAGDVNNLGEFGALADPATIRNLIDGRRRLESA